MKRDESQERIEKLLGCIVREMVDAPEEVEITASYGGNCLVLTVRVGDGEVGKIIGKQGYNIDAIRTIMEAVAAKYRWKLWIEIDDDRGNRK